MKPIIRLRRQRPGLAAEVGHVAHRDAGLLEHLAADGVLDRLARLDEAGQGRVPPLRPHGWRPSSSALVGLTRLAVGDDHDDGGVGARELLAAAARCSRSTWPACSTRARRRTAGSAGSPSPLREADGVKHQRAGGRAVGDQRGEQPAQRHPLVPLRPPRRPGRRSRRSGAPRRARRAGRAVPSGAPATGHPGDPSVDGRTRVPATRAPGCSGRPTLVQPVPRRCDAPPPGCARGRRGPGAGGCAGGCCRSRPPRYWPPVARRRAAYRRPMSTHIGARPGEIAPVVLHARGPPPREVVAENFLDDAQCYSRGPGMYGYTGTWRGHRVSVQGSGMGQPSLAIYAHRAPSASTTCIDRPRRLLRRAHRGGGRARRDHRQRARAPTPR